MTVSNLIDDGINVYASTWKGPIALNRETGEPLFKAGVSEVKMTYPVSIRKYGDTLVYVGEMVIAGVEGTTGKVLFNHGFYPVNQTMNLDAIDPLIKELIDYLTFFGKPALKGANVSTDNLGKNYLFNLSRASQESSTKLAYMSRNTYNSSQSSGSRADYFKSKIQYNQSLIESSFSRAYANGSMMLNAVSRAASAVSKMTQPDRTRLNRLMNDRRKLMELYQTQDDGEYIMRKMEETNGSNTINKVAVIHLPTGKVFNWVAEARSKGDVIINPWQNEFYYHELRIVTEMQKNTENITEETAAHAYYLVAIPLEQFK